MSPLSSPWPQRLSLMALWQRFPGKIVLTVLLVMVENALLVMIPLALGWGIDGVMAGSASGIWPLAILLVSVTLAVMVRRLYDTRAYGAIRVELGSEVGRRLASQPLSVRSARLDMSRELVDFLENELPPLLTAIIQLLAALIILSGFAWALGAAALLTALVMLGAYSLFHPRYRRLNHLINRQQERQVRVLQQSSGESLLLHLVRLRHREIQLSDTDALMYGLLYLMQFAFILANLMLAAIWVVQPSAGTLFAIVTYSWEFVEAAVMLPVALQGVSRLQSISARLMAVGSGAESAH
ncbi:ABC transporter six-transmembrane domain-containing protein [Ferrimonas futtsuensis]|uniref:ABC transporter six-transmembrane domain-containing protein n=1 Tax=Ferrimonas futtsuensis TaxID=364764 RepID=UPI00048061E4|nr:ABC transporter six-transmembrane domain-containing protein [Ferrimonas futtsuensis]